MPIGRGGGVHPLFAAEENETLALSSESAPAAETPTSHSGEAAEVPFVASLSDGWLLGS